MSSQGAQSPTSTITWSKYPASPSMSQPLTPVYSVPPPSPTPCPSLPPPSPYSMPLTPNSMPPTPYPPKPPTPQSMIPIPQQSMSPNHYNSQYKPPTPRTMVGPFSPLAHPPPMSPSSNCPATVANTNNLVYLTHGDNPRDEDSDKLKEKQVEEKKQTFKVERQRNPSARNNARPYTVGHQEQRNKTELNIADIYSLLNPSQIAELNVLLDVAARDYVQKTHPGIGGHPSLTQQPTHHQIPHHPNGYHPPQQVFDHQRPPPHNLVHPRTTQNLVHHQSLLNNAPQNHPQQRYIYQPPQSSVNHYQPPQNHLHQQQQLQHQSRHPPSPIMHQMLHNPVNMGNTPTLSGPPMNQESRPIQRMMPVPEVSQAAHGLPKRRIVLDGWSLGFTYGRHKFTALGLEKTLKYFNSLGFISVIILSKSIRTGSNIADRKRFEKMQKNHTLILTPSRKGDLGGRNTFDCGTEDYLVKYAAKYKGVIVSNKKFKNYTSVSSELQDQVERRVMGFAFSDKEFDPPSDPCGKGGPSLDEFLHFTSDEAEPCYKPERKLVKTDLVKRPIIIDGSNVGYAFTDNERFNVLGIEKCLKYFEEMGHEDTQVYIAQSMKERWQGHDQKKLEALFNENKLVFTPSRQTVNQSFDCYEDDYLVRNAIRKKAIIVSNDNFEDMIAFSPEYREQVEKRVLPFNFIDEELWLPEDPLGNSGPNLETFLHFSPDDVSQANQDLPEYMETGDTKADNSADAQFRESCPTPSTDSNSGSIGEWMNPDPTKVHYIDYNNL